MEAPTTWNEAAGRILGHYDKSTASIKGTLTEMDYIVQKMGWAVRAQHDVPDMLFIALSREAVGHLKSINEWDVDQMTNLLCSKQHDYGHDNIALFGIMGLVVRLSDKVARLKNLQRRQVAANESAIDTLRDIVGYCTIAEMLWDGTFYLDLEGAVRV